MSGQSTTVALHAPAPNISLPDGEGRAHALYQQIGPKGLLLVFLRGFWCAMCVQQLQLLRQHHARFAALGINIVVVMTDERARVAGALFSNPAPFPVLVDEGRAAIALYGVRNPLTLLPFPHLNVAHPSTILMDHDGTIQYLYVANNFTDRPNMADVLAAAETMAAAALVAA